MEVFISWSGATSKAVAEALRSWLPNVIQSLRPWMSAADLEKGARWSSDIAQHLQNTQIGIICLAPDNLNAPWILFEAGALSKTLDATFVCPFLFRVEPSDLKGPLVQFQSTRYEKEDTRRLLQTVNSALKPTPLSESQLNGAFDLWWPRLEADLRMIPEARDNLRPHRSDRELIEEVLEVVRNLARGRVADAKSSLSVLSRVGADQAAVMNSVLESLPEQDRKMLHAIFYEQKSPGEVAKQFGVERDYLRILFSGITKKFGGLLGNELSRLDNS